MKIPVDGYYIDLREVIAIGPLRLPAPPGLNCFVGGTGNVPPRIGCSVWLFGRNEPFWFTMAEGQIDPYQIDDAKNALVRATATANYNKLVADWQSVD